MARALGGPPCFNGNYNEGCTGACTLSSTLRCSDKSLCSGTPDTTNLLK